jgi:hypothetical protein
MTSNTITPAPSDGWGDAAKDAMKRVILGQLLLFSDWRWTVGKEHAPLSEGLLLAALSTAAGWVLWSGGKPVDYRMREPGGQLADRSELGYTEEALWEKGPGGDPQDPWRNSRFVYLVDQQTAEVYTFTTSSIGGIRAVSDLAEQIGRMRATHPGAVPIVRLEAAEMPTKFGRKSRPVFKVVEWQLGADGGEAKAASATRRLTSDRDFDGDDAPFSE